MIKILKLQKAVYAIIVGILALIAAQIMRNYKINGSSFVLGMSGGFLILGALLFLYPILFAKKVDKEEEKVALKPIGQDPVEEEDLI
ncbi:MAG: isoleucyl-tRNA synthetase [Bacteroidota bacterium]